jgi:bifunctional UDP-N-acetylglucosamine pyrophosphorylase/glucosamine-1-phosphate N-acetyltransferase
MSDLEIIILAAGKGTRMGSERPKVLVDVNGRPMLSYVLDAVAAAHPKKPLIVVGFQAEKVKEAMGPQQRYILQTAQLGTGHAVKEALAGIAADAKQVIVLNGDQPLVDGETIRLLHQAHVSQSQPLTIGTIRLLDFEGWRSTFYDFGRIVRDNKGAIVKIVEKNDATEHERAITEVSPSYFCFDAAWLRDRIHRLTATNPKGEYYLTDLIHIAQSEGAILNSIEIPAHQALGVNTPEQLATVLQFLQNEK